MNLFHRLGLPFWSILIAIVLWVQVHGQGMGSVRMDVALQVRDVPTDMVIVNDLPDQVSITISGLQAQLNSLDAQDLFVSVDASALNMPGVIEQALDIEAIDLPVGLKVEKIQPDSVQLQVDHVVRRTLEVIPMFDLPQGWEVQHVVITPSRVDLSGPEVWLSTLNKIETAALRLDLKQGLFDTKIAVVPLSGKGIHLLKKDVTIRVRGELTWTPTPPEKLDQLPNAEIPTIEGENNKQTKASIVPKPKLTPEVVEQGEQQVKKSIVPVPKEVSSDVEQPEKVNGDK